MRKQTNQRSGGLNKSGQALGRKGKQTRLSIIQATQDLLRESGGKIPAVSAIAKRADLSTTVFYLYFSDVGEVVLSQIDELQVMFRKLVALLREPWPEDEIYRRSLSFIEAYFDHWKENAAFLHARRQLFDRGDERIKRQRMRYADEIISALAAKLPKKDITGAERIDFASVLLTALERLATVITLRLNPEMRGGRKKNFIRGLAYVYYLAFSNTRIPARQFKKAKRK